MPTVNCHLLVQGLKTYKTVWVEVYLPAVPDAARDNEIKLELPVGIDEETSWTICDVKYYADPDPDCSEIHLYTKPVRLPESEAVSVIEELNSKFRVIVPDEALQDASHDLSDHDIVSIPSASE